MPAICHVAHHNACDHVMTPESIVATLHYHSVRAYVSDGVALAYEESSVKVADGVFTDTSDWIKAPTTIHELASWLGY